MGATRASAASSGCTATSAMCFNRRTCSPARFARISATAGRRRRTRRFTRRPERSARIASRRSSEQGYDTDVGECGDKLSTGEKQLISFARAVIARPKIFVLDEATSSVDTETEMLIQKATHTLMQGTTSFVIAHRAFDDPSGRRDSGHRPRQDRRAGHARAPAQGGRRIRRTVSYPVEQAGIIIFRLDFSRRVVYTVLT